MAAKHGQLVKEMERKLEASHTAMERKMLDIKWQDHVPNKTVKERSKLPELMAIIMRQKWKWAGHVSRMTNNWAHNLTMWKPHGKRNRGRPKKPLSRSHHKTSCRRKNWVAMSQDRTEWLSIEEAFILQWKWDGCCSRRRRQRWWWHVLIVYSHSVLDIGLIHIILPVRYNGI